ncbi:CLUMA_CG018457, isoform A [Clunio marinus]|uniref:CLUMA_CG018457, isoform A n=1 Tax=Clunio marinus TaxID=568069 RepID=A0A1J1IYY1_9DIPT|nr:CLUMA_CG018457, isoform A [Clunio marinus]
MPASRWLYNTVIKPFIAHVFRCESFAAVVFIHCICSVHSKNHSIRNSEQVLLENVQSYRH